MFMFYLFKDFLRAIFYFLLLLKTFLKAYRDHFDANIGESLNVLHYLGMIFNTSSKNDYFRMIFFYNKPRGIYKMLLLYLT